MREHGLSPSEWQVMKIVWQRGRVTVQDVLLDMAENPPPHGYHQVHLYLRRMIAKGYVRVDNEKRPHYYTPLVDRSTAVRQATERFLDDLLDGHPENLQVISRVVTERLQGEGA